VIPESEDALGKRKLSIFVSKTCEAKNEFNLRIKLNINNLDKNLKREKDSFNIYSPDTNITIFHPSETLIGEAEESANIIRFAGPVTYSSLEEALLTKKDKLKLEAAGYTFKKSIKLATKPYGEYTRTINLIEYFAEKILQADNSRDNITKEFIEKKLEDYSVNTLPIYPTENLAESYTISVPIANPTGDLYLLVNAAIQHRSPRAGEAELRGERSDVVIKIPYEKLVDQNELPTNRPNRPNKPLRHQGLIKGRNPSPDYSATQAYSLGILLGIPGAEKSKLVKENMPLANPAGKK